MPLYALSIAHTNDFLSKREMVTASSGLQLAGGIGLTIGPILGGLAIDIIGTQVFGYIFLIHTSLGLFGIYRMTIRTAVRGSRKHCTESKQ